MYLLILEWIVLSWHTDFFSLSSKKQLISKQGLHLPPHRENKQLQTLCSNQPGSSCTFTTSHLHGEILCFFVPRQHIGWLSVTRDHHQCTPVTSQLMGSDMCWTFYILLKYKNLNCSCSRKSDSVAPSSPVSLWNALHRVADIPAGSCPRLCAHPSLLPILSHPHVMIEGKIRNLLSQSFRIAENNATLLVAGVISKRSWEDMAELLKKI